LGGGRGTGGNKWPKNLNALSSTMVTGIMKCFTSYEEDNGIKLLIVKGKRRAFCAEGDVAEVSQSVDNGTLYVDGNMVLIFPVLSFC